MRSQQTTRPGLPPARSTVPASRGPLVGRAQDLREVLRTLRQARLVTLTGPGGVGKTRLALAVLPLVRELGADGVFWVDLAGLQAPELVAQSLARAVGALDRGDVSPTEAVVDRLRSSTAVVALDNCEHLAGASAELVNLLLDGCGRVRVLATSREPLGVVDEATWPVPTLSLPPSPPRQGGAVNLESVCGSASAQLFEQRARQVDPGFRIAPAQAGDVARLCRRLDGLPLAIELAAVRLRVLTVAQIASGLEDAMGLLVGGARSGPARHQTLRAALDWSHDLLTAAERIVFRRLAVFPGSFDLAAAQAVVSGAELGSADVLDLMTRLVERSLLTVSRDGPCARYRLLAPVREYARARLAASGEREEVGSRHLRWFCAVAETAEPLLEGPEQSRTLDALEADGANLRAALVFARERPDHLPGVRLAVALWRLCSLRGHYREGRQWLDWAASVQGGPEPTLRAAALRGSGMLALLECDYPAAVHRLELALALYREADDGTGLAGVLQALGCVAREQGRYGDAAALHEQSLALYAEAQDPVGVARSQNYLAFVAWLQRDWPTARRRCEAALGGFTVVGEAEGLAWSLINLAAVALLQGEFDRADQLVQQAGSVSRDAGYPEGVAWAEHLQGLILLRSGRPGARELLLDSLCRHRDLGDRWQTASVLGSLAQEAAGVEAPERAARLLGAADAVRRQIGTAPAPWEERACRQSEARARAALSSSEFDRAWRAGAGLGVDAALDDPLTGRPVGETASASGPWPAAASQAEDPWPAAATQAQDTADDERPGAWPRPAAAVRIRVLGAAEVLLDGRPVTAADWGYAKPRELLFLLTVQDGCTKEEIGRALWPDLDGGRLRNAFHTALRALRHALPLPGLVSFEGGRYRLDAGVDCDLRDFRAELEAARTASAADQALSHLRAAAAGLEGDLLPGVQGEWVEEGRHELAAARSRALTGAVRLSMQTRRFADAAAFARRAVRLEPLSESATRALMLALIELGEQPAAVEAYQRLADRLQAELDVRPGDRTQALLRRATSRSG